MKFKITCSSQPRSSVVKKIISGSLTMGLLFNSTLPSFASALSEDGRYEAFEGNNITIDNVLEEEKVDVEIEGKTIINLVKKPEITEVTTSTTNLKEMIRMRNTPKSIKVKPNTRYTVIVEYTVKEATDNSEFYVEGNFFTQDAQLQWFTKGFTTGLGTKKEIFQVNTCDNVESLNNIFVGLHSANGELATATVELQNMILLDGEYSENELKNLEYFEGMKSAGEMEFDNKIKVLSQPKNLINRNDIIQGGYGWRDGAYVPTQDRCTTNNFIKVNSGNVIYRNKESVIFLYDKNFNYLGNGEIGYNGTGKYSTDSYLIEDGVSYIHIEFRPLYGNNPSSSVFNDITISYYPIKEKSTYEISLSEPLRGLPNGIKDRIIKKNGQWVVERNCREIILDGTENWSIGTESNGWAIYDDSLVVYTDSYAPKANSRYICDKLPYVGGSGVCAQNILGTTNQTWSSVGHISIRLPYSYLETENLYGFKQWLSKNNLKIVYQLEVPIYEPLNIESTVNTYLDTTHISNNSNIPANMKVAVDRTINKAVEAIELAKLNPTTENLSDARYWTNLLKESTKKDELQSVITNIVGPSDIELERKTVSVNTDVYVKSENMLSMSLSTNSVSFNDYSGVEDMEILNAVNITINSSLPYNLNAYMPNEIISSNSSKIDKEVLNIRDNSEEDYQNFDNNTNKLVLKDGCAEGNNKQHSIDLKLKSDNAHTADIYRTVIKFEAEQK